MQKFEITLKNEKVKMYRLIAIIILILNFSIFTFLLFSEVYRPIAIVSIVALGFYVLLRTYVFKRNRQIHFFDEFVFFVSAMCWFGLNNYTFMILLVIMGILFRFSLQDLKFVFSRDNVTKMNFPKKELPWNLFSNVILKDNILTLDLKNNKLIQAEIKTEQAINENEFNEFAQSQISRSENI